MRYYDLSHGQCYLSMSPLALCPSHLSCSEVDGAPAIVSVADPLVELGDPEAGAPPLEAVGVVVTTGGESGLSPAPLTTFQTTFDDASYRSRVGS